MAKSIGAPAPREVVLVQPHLGTVRPQSLVLLLSDRLLVLEVRHRPSIAPRLQGLRRTLEPQPRQFLLPLDQLPARRGGGGTEAAGTWGGQERARGFSPDELVHVARALSELGPHHGVVVRIVFLVRPRCERKLANGRPGYFLRWPKWAMR